MKKALLKRAISLLLCATMLVTMASMLTGISAFAATETTIFSSLDPKDWDYDETSSFYFDNSTGYLNSTAATGASGKSIVSKNELNLGSQFSLSFLLGAKSATTNNPSNVDYGFSFNIGNDLKVVLVHDSKWSTYWTTNTANATEPVHTQVYYKGVLVYDKVVMTNKWAAVGAGVNNVLNKRTYYFTYNNGVMNMYSSLWNANYPCIYTDNGDGTFTSGINLVDLVEDFVPEQVIFKNKMTVTMYCAAASDVYTLQAFTLSAVPAEDAKPVESYTVASENEAYGTVVAASTNPETVYSGDKLTFTAIPNEGYRFAGWYKANGAVASANATATFDIFEGSEFYAHFVSLADHTQVDKPKRATILCLGDSITDGYCIASGYRSYLMKKLYAEGAYFDFSVGKYRDDDDCRLPVGYRNHGGLSGVGFKAYGSLKTAVTYLDSSMGVADADIALIMIGTNDYSHYPDTASDYIGGMYREYLDTLYTQNPNLIIYCASVINQKTGKTPAADEGAVNDQLPGIVAEYAALGHDIHFVDMNALSGLVSDDYADGVHPNESGASKMADVWYDAIVDKVFEVNSQGDNTYVAPVKAESVTVNGENTVIYTGNSGRTQMTAKILPANTEMTTVEWSVSDETVAKIDSFGNITPIKAGVVDVTATTLDGSLTDTKTVTIVDGTNPDMENLLFTADYSTTEGWTGDISAVNAGASNIFANYANKVLNVSTADTFLADKYFRLHFCYRVYGNNDANHNGKYNEVSYGGYSLRFNDCKRSIALYYDGTLVQTVYSSSISDTLANYYDLVYDKGTVKVYENNILLASVANSAAPVESAISIKYNEVWRASYTSDMYLVGVEIPPIEYNSTSLSLDGDIGLNFYVTLNNEQIQAGNTYMEMSVSGMGARSNTVYTRDLSPDSKGRYKFTFNVNVLEMAETVTAKFHCSDSTVIERAPTSIIDYVEKARTKYNDDDSNKTVALAKAIANYGHYSQLALQETHGFTIGDSADYKAIPSYGTVNIESASTLSDHAPSKSGSNADITAISRALALDDKTSVILYFTVTKGYVPSNVSVTKESDPVDFTFEEFGERYKLTVANIPVHQLKDKFTVNADGLTINVSALSYAYSVLNSSSTSENYKLAVSALYQYYLKAIAY